MRGILLNNFYYLLSGVFLFNSTVRCSDDVLFLNKIISHHYSFTAPIVSDDSLYITSFFHDDMNEWSGKLYKFKVTNEGRVLDRNGEDVFDCNGNIYSSSHSFWFLNNTDDVSAILKKKSDRRILTDLSQNELIKFSLLSGSDRQKIPPKLGDSMHSKPVVLDYGFQHLKHDRRILLATNAGLLHMFHEQANELDESWAFMPAEFVALQTDDHKKNRYTLDGELTVYHDDIDHDGVIESSEGDRLWLFFGLRQGGRSYYAIDLTEPDHPILKWKINGEQSAYSLLGETWSVPQVAHIRGRGDVIIVGGGNALSKSMESETTKLAGQAIYIIDADSGQKLFSISANPDSLTNLKAPLKYPIPAAVALLDSDFDGFDDRFYVGDTGGNVWRVDMKGDFSNWKISQFASLQTEDDLSSNHTPHFFGQPIIARSLLRTKVQENEFADVPADWIMLGSGERDDVQSMSTNRYFALPDRQVTPYAKQDSIAEPLTMKDLHPIFYDKSKAQPSGVFMQGWYANLAQEKLFGNGYVVAGKVWFTSFLPATTNDKTQSIGSTQLYKIDLITGAYADAQVVSEQYADRLLENLGVSYQEQHQQLWMTGLPSRKTNKCSNVGMSISSALQPRKIAEYFSND